MLAAILALMAFCAAIAWGLTQLLGSHADAYWRPAGRRGFHRDHRAGTHVDLGFVMAFQTARLILVILIADPRPPRRAGDGTPAYSTVTDFARLRG
jgi:uncharacterized membrane protein AbrB (regulator of aidB expression)